MGTVTLQPSSASVGCRRVLWTAWAAPHQILASLACPCRPRRVPLDEGTYLAAAFAREEVRCYVLSYRRHSCHDRRDRNLAAAALLMPSSRQLLWPTDPGLTRCLSGMMCNRCAACVKRILDSQITVKILIPGFLCLFWKICEQKPLRENILQFCISYDLRPESMLIGNVKLKPKGR